MKRFYILFAVIFIFSCQTGNYDENPCKAGELLNSCYIDQASIDNYLSNNTFAQHYDDYFAGKINSAEELIDEYESMDGTYLPSYSSMTDVFEYRMTVIENILGRDSVQNKLTDREKKRILLIASDKLGKKFGVDYTDPFYARKTGMILILKILQSEKAENSEVCGYCNQYRSENPENTSVVSNDEKFARFLQQYVSKYLSN